jgi:hypothetical protein
MQRPRAGRRLTSETELLKRITVNPGIFGGKPIIRVWGGVRDALLADGHDVVWTGDWAEDPGDDEILAFAHQEGRALVTLDKDFGRLLFLMNRNSSGSQRGESGR